MGWAGKRRLGVVLKGDIVFASQEVRCVAREGGIGVIKFFQGYGEVDGEESGKTLHDVFKIVTMVNV